MTQKQLREEAREILSRYLKGESISPERVGCALGVLNVPMFQED